jgi:homospermidine synthase
MGRRRNIFTSWMDFVAEDSRGFWEDFNAKFIRKLIQILRMVRVATPKKKTTDQTVATICQGALCGAAVTMAAVQSAVKIDDLLAFHQRLTGRPATQKKLRILKKRCVRKLHRIEAPF